MSLRHARARCFSNAAHAEERKWEAPKALLCILASFAVTFASADFCEKALYHDSFICEDGTDVNVNGCCASTNRCPKSCRFSQWMQMGASSTCTCHGCNKRLKWQLDDAQRYMLATNYFRCRHGREWMTWDATLASHAQTWADTCPLTDGHQPHIRPDGSNSYDLKPMSGENVAAGQKSPEGAVQDWYEEISKYQAGSKATHETGHYTALMWKTTRSLGCAQAPCSQYQHNPVHVCHYSNAPPNYGDVPEFVVNVPQSPAPVETEDTCCDRVYSHDNSQMAGVAQTPAPPPPAVPAPPAFSPPAPSFPQQVSVPPPRPVWMPAGNAAAVPLSPYANVAGIPRTGAPQLMVQPQEAPMRLLSARRFSFTTATEYV